tara:strand:+ start:237 stop:482 length:246 start_codon:yes stop_codon:yes gene_type:complete
MYLTKSGWGNLTTESQVRSTKGVKVIFRGVSKKDPKKVIVVVQALEGVLEKQIQENFDIFEENGAVMSTANQVTGLEDPIS